MKSTIKHLCAVAIAAFTSNVLAKEAPSYDKLEVDNKQVFNQIFAEQQAEIIFDGGTWTEGPVYSEVHQTLFFSDVPEGKIWAIKNGVKTLMVTNSGGKELHGSKELKSTWHAEPGANGLALDIDENGLFLAQHKARRIVRLPITSSGELVPHPSVITSSFKNRRFNSPNDMAVHPTIRGRMYFTDPPYGLMPKSNWQDGNYLKEEQDLQYQGVYQMLQQGHAPLLIDDTLHRPNGVVLSADGESLFVAVSCSGDFEPSCVQGDVIFAKYSIGGLDNTEVTKVATFKHQFGKSTVGAADGLSFHADTGYLVSSCPLGLCIIDFSEEGKLLAHIKLGDKPVRTSNISFGKERGQQYAFVTGTEKVWKIKMMPIVQSDEL